MKKLNPERYPELIKIARDSIIHGLIHGSDLIIDPSTLHPDLLTKARTFVSIKVNDQFRGCIGNIELQPIFVAVKSNAFKAAFKDIRYTPLNNYWLSKSTIEIYHLYDIDQFLGISSQELMNKIKPEHTVSLTFEKYTATMLNSMQKYYGNNKQQFLDSIIKKANIPAGTPCQR